MSKPALCFDEGETYSLLMDEIRAINNVASLIDGKVDAHLSTRLKAAGAKAHELLTRNVVTGTNHRDVLSPLFDKEGNVTMYAEEPRGHVNTDLDREIGEATWAPDREQLQYDKEKEEEV